MQWINGCKIILIFSVSTPKDRTICATLAQIIIIILIIIILIITVISLSAPSSIPIILVDRSWRKVCSEENKNLVRKGAHFKYSFMSCLLWSTLLQLSSSSLSKWNYHYCSSQPSIVHWLSSPIFPCSLFVCPSHYGLFCLVYFSLLVKFEKKDQSNLMKYRVIQQDCNL